MSRITTDHGCMEGWDENERILTVRGDGWLARAVIPEGVDTELGLYVGAKPKTALRLRRLGFDKDDSSEDASLWLSRDIQWSQCLPRLHVINPPTDEMRGRIVACQKGAQGYRFLARAAGGMGVIQAEAVAPQEVFAGQIVMLGRGAHVWVHTPIGNVGLQTPHWWLSPTAINGPIIDDSDGPGEDIIWLLNTDQGDGVQRNLERVDDLRRGRCWLYRMSTRRGESTHIKFPAETWEQMCEAVGA